MESSDAEALEPRQGRGFRKKKMKNFETGILYIYFNKQSSQRVLKDVKSLLTSAKSI